MILFSDHIEIFFTKYINVFEDTSLKPKAHFVMHYPKMMKRFGPFVKTLRFECHNGYLKGLYSNSKNRKNVCQHLAKRHQFKIYLHHNNENTLRHNDAIGAKV